MSSRPSRVRSDLLLAFPATAAGAEESKPWNIAPGQALRFQLATGVPLAGVNDNRMETQWSTVLGQTSGQWLRLARSEPREIRAVAPLANPASDRVSPAIGRPRCPR